MREILNSAVEEISEPVVRGQDGVLAVDLMELGFDPAKRLNTLEWIGAVAPYIAEEEIEQSLNQGYIFPKTIRRGLYLPISLDEMDLAIIRHNGDRIARPRPHIAPLKLPGVADERTCLVISPQEFVHLVRSPEAMTTAVMAEHKLREQKRAERLSLPAPTDEALQIGALQEAWKTLESKRVAMQGVVGAIKAENAALQSIRRDTEFLWRTCMSGASLSLRLDIAQAAIHRTFDEAAVTYNLGSRTITRLHHVLNLRLFKGSESSLGRGLIWRGYLSTVGLYNNAKISRFDQSIRDTNVELTRRTEEAKDTQWFPTAA